MRRRRWIIAALACLLLAALGAYLIWAGIIPLNNPSHEKYPVRGVDVSHYQGDIDWQVLSGQGIAFAFIKATEGSSYVDPCFARNYAGARETQLRVGAYHFFSFDSPGDTQADNFIASVEGFDSMLPPVVDVEFYGDKEKNPPDAETVRAQLHILLTRLEAHYGVKPILYATGAAYDLYIANEFAEHPIWIRDVICTPKLSDGRDWLFWQYSNRARLSGYDGQERFIDMNVFAGSAEAFAQLS